MVYCVCYKFPLGRVWSPTGLLALHPLSPLLFTPNPPTPDLLSPEPLTPKLSPWATPGTPPRAHRSALRQLGSSLRKLSRSPVARLRKQFSRSPPEAARQAEGEQGAQMPQLKAQVTPSPSKRRLRDRLPTPKLILKPMADKPDAKEPVEEVDDVKVKKKVARSAASFPSLLLRASSTSHLAISTSHLASSTSHLASSTSHLASSTSHLASSSSHLAMMQPRRLGQATSTSRLPSTELGRARLGQAPCKPPRIFQERQERPPWRN